MSDAQNTELAVLPRASLPTILAADTEDVLGKLARELADFEPDATTPQGRAEIGSKAGKVGKAKMDLVRLANGLTEGWRKQTAAVVAERKTLEERMDGLRKQIEAPREEYNARENRRTDGHEAAIREFAVVFQSDDSASEIAELIDFVTDLHAGRDWEEFERKARAERLLSLDTLRFAYQTAKTREDEAEAEAARQAEEAARKRLADEEARRLREEQIAVQAAERAKRDAEEIATAQLKAAEALRAHQAAEAAREKREAEEALAKAEQDKKDAIARAEAAARKVLTDAMAWIEQAPQRINPDWSYDDQIAACGSGVARINELLSEHAWGKMHPDAMNIATVAIATLGDVIEKAKDRREYIANSDRVAAEQKAERDRIEAVEVERRRVAAEAKRKREEDQKRAANVAHQRKINREIIADLMEHAQWPEGTPLAEALATKIMMLLVKGTIRNVKVQY